jgi:Transposase DDE domain group 1
MYRSYDIPSTPNPRLSAMTNRTRNKTTLKRLRNQAIEAQFDGGTLTSDGGLLLLREVDQKLKLIERIDRVIPDRRDLRYCIHSQAEISKLTISTTPSHQRDRLHYDDRLVGHIAKLEVSQASSRDIFASIGLVGTTSFTKCWRRCIRYAVIMRTDSRFERSGENRNVDDRISRTSESQRWIGEAWYC